MRQTTQEVAHHALGQVARQVGQMRSRSEPIRVQGDVLLKPRSPESVVAEAELGVAFAAFEPQLLRGDDLQQHRPVQEPKIGQDASPADVPTEGLANLVEVHGLAGALPCVATGQPVHFLQEGTVPALAAFPHPKIVLDGPLDHRLVQLIGHLRPGYGGIGLGYRIPTAFRERLEGSVAKLPVSPAQLGKLPPSLHLGELLEAICGQQGLEIPLETQAGHFAEQQGAEFDGRNPPRKAVPPSLHTQRRTAGHEHVNLVMIDQSLQLWGPVLEVLYFVQEQERRAVGSGGLVESRAQDAVLEPASQGQHRVGQRAQGR